MTTYRLTNVETGKAAPVTEAQLPSVCLKLAGGGLNEAQTRKAMEIQHQVLDGRPYQGERFRLERLTSTDHKN